MIRYKPLILSTALACSFGTLWVRVPSALPAAMQGTGFTGRTVALDRRYPTDTRVPSKYGKQVVAKSGSSFLAGPCSVKVTATQITITLSALSNKYTFKNSTYNGYRLTILAQPGIQSTPPIGAVTIDPSTNVQGFRVSRISHAANYVKLNLAGLIFGVKDRVVLDVVFVAGRGKGKAVRPSAVLRPSEQVG